MSQEQLGRFDGPGAPVPQVYNAVLPVLATAASAETISMSARIDALPHPRVGVVGRLSPEKGVDVMLHAAQALRRAGS